MTADVPHLQQVSDLPAMDRLPPASRQRFALEVARMADGTDIRLPVLVLVGSAPHPRLLMVAGVHGDEYEGIAAQLELWHALAPAQLAGTVVMVPVANPPAFRARRRCSLVDPLDMNRLFPGDATGSLTQRLAHRLFADILPGTDLVLSMHGWSAGGVVVPYVEYPSNTEVHAVSRAAACAFGLEYVEALAFLSGRLGPVANRAGYPAIEAEIGGLNTTQPEGRALYRRGSLNVG